MSVPKLYNDVISGLLQKSQKKEVIWNTTTDSNTFIVYFDKFSLSIRQKCRGDFNNPETWITIDIINDDGENIDGFEIEEGDTDWNEIIELFTLARRSALSIDNAIQTMLTEICKSGIIGKKKDDDNTSSSNDSFVDDIPF
jgi:hypothetical protein